MITSSKDNLDFVSIPLFLRAALQVAIETMHFHITQAGLFLGTIFSHSDGPRVLLAPMKNCPGAKYVKLDTGVYVFLKF